MSALGPNSDCEVELTQDKFLGGRLNILQPAKAYRAGLDAVLLAAAVPFDRAGTCTPVRVLDAGAGVGVVGLCLAARCPRAQVLLAERDPMLLEIARRNIALNELSDRVSVLGIDVSAGGGALYQDGAEGPLDLIGGFDFVVANPPYYRKNSGTSPSSKVKARAHQMDAGELDGWFRFLSTVAARDATMTMIHRADALPEILAACQGRFGGLKILPIHAKFGAPAIRVLVQGRKGSRAPLCILSGLVLHDDTQSYSEELQGILREGRSLEM